MSTDQGPPDDETPMWLLALAGKGYPNGCTHTAGKSPAGKVVVFAPVNFGETFHSDAFGSLPVGWILETVNLNPRRAHFLLLNVKANERTLVSFLFEPQGKGDREKAPSFWDKLVEDAL